jgi:hypothetical protein
MYQMFNSIYSWLILFWYDVSVWSYNQMLKNQTKLAKLNKINMPKIGKEEYLNNRKEFFDYHKCKSL